jgi:hypothetical protein
VAVTETLSVATAIPPTAQETAEPGERETDFAVVAEALAPKNTKRVSVAATGFWTRQPLRAEFDAITDWKVPPAVTVVEALVEVTGLTATEAATVALTHALPVVSWVTG